MTSRAARQPSTHGSALPVAKQHELVRAQRQEWATLALRLSVIAALYGVVGNSQALSAIWLKSLWALWPPVAFLAALAIEQRPATRRFPFGFHRAVSIGFMTSALSLVAMGLYLLIAGLRSYLLHEPDKLAAIAGAPTWWQWPGWWVVAALAYSLVVPLVIGRRRMIHARNLHDKGLYADAAMGRLNWMAAGLAIVGVLGIGLGAAWLDVLATLVIGGAIFVHGLRHLFTAVCDLMDEEPRLLGTDTLDPLADDIHQRLLAQAWIRDCRVRLREEGRRLTGVALVCPEGETAAVADIQALRAVIAAMDWRLLDVQLVPISADDFARECQSR